MGGNDFFDLRFRLVAGISGCFGVVWGMFRAAGIWTFWLGCEDFCFSYCEIAQKLRVFFVRFGNDCPCFWPRVGIE